MFMNILTPLCTAHVMRHASCITCHTSYFTLIKSSFPHFKILVAHLENIECHTLKILKSIYHNNKYLLITSI